MNKSLVDPLNNLDGKQVAANAFRLIDRIQTEPKAMQVQALATTFLLLLDVLEIDPRAELERAGRIMKDADQKYCDHFRTVRAYIEGELK